jgi:SAM-dependent MidA family methyltransferase/chemotaxis receptor (MCP) glutamine deamidase CheD
MMKRKFPKIFYFLLCFLLIFEQSGFAQVAGQLDISGYFTGLRNIINQDKFRPLHLRYLSYDNTKNSFDLLLDKGDAKDLKEAGLKESTRKLLNYFLTGVTLTNDSFWVNLRPDSPDNIIDDYLSQTEAGRILLEADVQLKKDTAAYTSPQTPEGKVYWDKLYKKAEELFGQSNITIPTLVRPWIVPGEIIIREAENNAYIYKATLKVLLEDDYLKNSATYNFQDPRLKTLNEYSSQLIKEKIIPKLTKEVNTSKKYSSLRQVYYSLILAQWFKSRFSGKSGLYSSLIDKKDLTGLISAENWSKQKYFQEYQSSFKDGEYNLKEKIYSSYGQAVRTYTSGGINISDIGISSSPITPGKVFTNGPLTIIGSSKAAHGLFTAPLIAMTMTAKGQPSISSPLTSVRELNYGSHDNSNKELFIKIHDSKGVYVPTGDWKSSSDLLKTFGAANCIVSLLIDNQAGQGVMGHYPYVVSKHSDKDLNTGFYGFVEAVRAMAQANTRYTLYLFGGTPMGNSAEAIKEAEKNKAAVRKALSDALGTHIDEVVDKTAKGTEKLDWLIADIKNKEVTYHYTSSPVDGSNASASLEGAIALARAVFSNDAQSVLSGLLDDYFSQRRKLLNLYDRVAEIAKKAAKKNFGVVLYPASGSDISAAVSYADTIVSIDNQDIFTVMNAFNLFRDKETALKERVNSYLEKKLELGFHSSGLRQGFIEYLAELLLLGADLSTLQIVEDRYIGNNRVTTAEFSIATDNGIKRKIRHTHILHVFDGQPLAADIVEELKKIIGDRADVLLLSKAGADLDGSKKWMTPIGNILAPGTTIVSDSFLNIALSRKLNVSGEDTGDLALSKMNNYGYTDKTESLGFYEIPLGVVSGNKSASSPVDASKDFLISIELDAIVNSVSEAMAHKGAGESANLLGIYMSGLTTGLAKYQDSGLDFDTALYRLSMAMQQGISRAQIIELNQGARQWQWLVEKLAVAQKQRLGNPEIAETQLIQNIKELTVGGKEIVIHGTSIDRLFAMVASKQMIQGEFNNLGKGNYFEICKGENSYAAGLDRTEVLLLFDKDRFIKDHGLVAERDFIVRNHVRDGVVTDYEFFVIRMNLPMYGDYLKYFKLITSAGVIDLNNTISANQTKPGADLSVDKRAYSVHVVMFETLLEYISQYSSYPLPESLLSGKILNIGLETNSYTGELNDENITTYLYAQGKDVVGLDPNPEFGVKFAGKGKFVTGVAQKIPFADNTFDTVISVGLFNPEMFDLSEMHKQGVLTLADFYTQAAREIGRVLKDKGVLLITTGSVVRGLDNDTFTKAFRSEGFDIYELPHGCFVLTNKKPNKAAASSPVSNIYDAVAENIKGLPDKRISFDKFMNIVHGHPQYGYYPAQARIEKDVEDGFLTFTEGREGEYLAQAISNRLMQKWLSLGSPSVFTIVEMGAGNGTLAFNILNKLREQESKYPADAPTLYKSLRYVIVEISQDNLRIVQEAKLREFQGRVDWVGADARNLTPLSEKYGKITGVFLSNELADDFGVHRVRINDAGQPQELYVTIDDNGVLHDAPGPISDLRINAYLNYLKTHGIKLAAGREIAVNLEALDWQNEMESILERGEIITIDYAFGDLAQDHHRSEAGRDFAQARYAVWSGKNSGMGPEEIYQKIQSGASVNITSWVDFGYLAGQYANRYNYSGVFDQADFIERGGFVERTAGKRESRVIIPLSDGQWRKMSPFKVLIQSKTSSSSPIANLRWFLTRNLNGPVSNFIQWLDGILLADSHIFGEEELLILAQELGISQHRAEVIIERVKRMAQHAYLFSESLPRDGKANVFLFRDAFALYSAERIKGRKPYAFYLSKATFKKFANSEMAEAIIPFMFNAIKKDMHYGPNDQISPEALSEFKARFFKLLSSLIEGKEIEQGEYRQFLPFARNLRLAAQGLQAYLEEIGLNTESIKSNGIRFIDTTLQGSLVLFMEGIINIELQKQGVLAAEAQSKTDSYMYFSRLSPAMSFSSLDEAREVESLLYPIEFKGIGSQGVPEVTESAGSKDVFLFQGIVLRNQLLQQSLSSSSPVTGEKRLFIGQLAQFTHLTPENFIQTYYSWLTLQKQRELTAGEIAEIKRFSLLLMSTGLFWRHTSDAVESAKTLGELRGTLIYDEDFPGVCEEAAVGSLRIIKAGGFLAQHIKRANPQTNEVYNYVEAVVAGETLIVDLAADYFELVDRPVTTMPGHDLTGIVIIPKALLNSADHVRNLPMYTKWNIQASSASSPIENLSQEALEEEFQGILGDEIDRQIRMSASPGRIQSMRERLQEAFAQIDSAEVVKIGIGPKGDTIFKFISDQIGIIFGINLDSRSTTFMAVLDIGSDSFTWKEAEASRIYKIIPDALREEFFQQTLDFLQRKGIKNIRDESNEYNKHVYFSLINPYVDKNTILEWYKSYPLFRYFLNRAPKRMLNHKLSNLITLRREARFSAHAIPAEGRPYEIGIERGLIVRKLWEKSLAYGPQMLMRAYIHEIIHLVLASFTDEQLATTRQSLDSVRNIVQSFYQGRNNRSWDEEAIAYSLDALVGGSRSSSIGGRITDEAIESLVRIGLLESASDVTQPISSSLGEQNVASSPVELSARQAQWAEQLLSFGISAQETTDILSGFLRAEDSAELIYTSRIPAAKEQARRRIEETHHSKILNEQDLREKIAHLAGVSKFTVVTDEVYEAVINSLVEKDREFAAEKAKLETEGIRMRYKAIGEYIAGLIAGEPYHHIFQRNPAIVFVIAGLLLPAIEKEEETSGLHDLFVDVIKRDAETGVFKSVLNARQDSRDQLALFNLVFNTREGNFGKRVKEFRNVEKILLAILEVSFRNGIRQAYSETTSSPVVDTQMVKALRSLEGLEVKKEGETYRFEVQNRDKDNWDRLVVLKNQRGEEIGFFELSTTSSGFPNARYIRITNENYLSQGFARLILDEVRKAFDDGTTITTEIASEESLKELLEGKTITSTGIARLFESAGWKFMEGGYYDGNGEYHKEPFAEIMGDDIRKGEEGFVIATFKSKGIQPYLPGFSPRETDESTSSPIATDEKGGIDFRTLPIITQPAINTQLSNITMPGQLANVNLDESWSQMQNMLKAGIIPSSERIKEYLQVCCAKKDIDQEMDKLLACIADILRLQEEQVVSTDLSLKEMLALLESNQPINQIQFDLGKIMIPEKEVLAIAQ